MREKFEGYIFKHAVQPLKLVAVVAIVAELSRRGLMFIGVPAFTSFITNMLGILIIMLMQKPIMIRGVYETKNRSSSYRWMHFAITGLQSMSVVVLLLIPIYER